MLVDLPALDHALPAAWDEIRERHEQRRHDRQRPLLPPEEAFTSAKSVQAALDRHPRIAITAIKVEPIASAQSFVNFGAEPPPELQADPRAPQPAPWTLASYMVEGGGSKSYVEIKKLMFGAPEVYRALMEKITDTVADYLVAQVKAGAEAIQLFDSWAGALSPRDYAKLAAPWSTKIIKAVKRTGVPVIHFVYDGGGVLEQVRDTGADVVGLDWRVDIDVARKRLGRTVAVQGNLDPCCLFLPEKELRARVREVLRANAAQPGHIFNLGHGILPQCSVKAAQILVDEVHKFKP